MHQNDSVTKKPLPADPADVQRLKGKLQSVPINSGATTVTPAAPVSSNGETSSTTPVPVLEVNMLRVDRQQLEPEPGPIRRHPVANWRPHAGPTKERHPRFLRSMPEPEISMLNSHLFRVNGVMRYVMLPKLKLLLILLLLCPLPEANNFFVYHVILNLLV